VAEILDAFLIRPACIAGAAWLARDLGLPGGVWLGFVIGKVAADVTWYGMEAASRWSIVRSTSGRVPAGPYLLLDSARAVDGYRALAAALPEVSIYYAVKATPHVRLLAALHRAGCAFEVASWAEVRAVERVGGNPADLLFTHPVKLPADVARARKAGV
jgi:hypothetical protein